MCIHGMSTVLFLAHYMVTKCTTYSAHNTLLAHHDMLSEDVYLICVMASHTITHPTSCIFQAPCITMAACASDFQATYCNVVVSASVSMVVWHMQGLVQNQSFYPYYGSAQKLVYEADALSSNIYSSTFTPYTSFTLTDTYPPAFMLGYPTAVNINDTTFTLAAAFYEAATVYYIIMPAASVSRSGFCTF